MVISVRRAKLAGAAKLANTGQTTGLGGALCLVRLQWLWHAVALEDHLVTNKVLAFRLVSCAGAVAHESLVWPHSGYPWRAFGLAAGQLGVRLGEGLRRERRCLFDTWTRQFVQHWGEDGLDSEDAEVDCLATASMVLSDTSVIEARHA